MISSKGGPIQADAYRVAREKREQDVMVELEVSHGTSPSKRTSVGLRNALFDEIDALRRGDGDATRAIAVSKLAATIVDTVRVEMQYHKAGMANDAAQKGIVLGEDRPKRLPHLRESGS